MFKRLLKLLSGLAPLCGRRGAAAPRALAGDNSDLNDLLERILAQNPPTDWEALAPDYVDDRRPARRADYRACDTCDAFLTGEESSRLTCRRCAARRFRHGPRPVRVAVAVGGVELSLPMDCPVAAGGQTPRRMVRIGSGQAEALSRILLKPGSDGMGIGYDGNDGMLMVGWLKHGTREIDIEAWDGDKRSASLSLTAGQAARLGEDVAACLGIIFTDAPTCDHEFVDARNEHVASGELCVRCGAIRAGNGNGA